MLQGLPKSVDVAVIGAGMVGAATAFELQKRGKTVIVIDPNNAWGRASYGNSGVITRSILLPMSSPAVWSHLAAYAFNRTNGLRIRYQDATALMPWAVRFLRVANQGAFTAAVSDLDSLLSLAPAKHIELAKALDTSSWLRHTGWIRAHLHQKTLPAVQAESALFEQYGIAHELLKQSDINALEPSLQNHFAHGIYFPDAMVLPKPGRLVERVIDCIKQRGAHLVEGKADWIRQCSDGVEIGVQQETIRANTAVISAGVAKAKLRAVVRLATRTWPRLCWA